MLHQAHVYQPAPQEIGFLGAAAEKKRCHCIISARDPIYLRRR